MTLELIIIFFIDVVCCVDVMFDEKGRICLAEDTSWRWKGEKKLGF